MSVLDQVIKQVCLVVNRILEMFSIKFGASFVFKSCSKFAFKNKLEKNEF
jgi:hypothetical protein